MKPLFLYVALLYLLVNCQAQKSMHAEIYETSASGNKLTKIEPSITKNPQGIITIHPEQKFQKISGFGGAFTESSAYLLNKLSKANRDKILHAYFSVDGANYSFCRTHIASCDFSLSNYTYAPVPDDKNLEHFSVQEDLQDLVPMIQDAQKISKEGFKLLASPWTAPPWMKDNNKWIDGKLLPQYRETYAKYLAKYIHEYQKLGVDIWGITVVNEPNGNGGNWESMRFTPKEMTDFVADYLGPEFYRQRLNHIKILGYDQNRDDLKNWVNEMYRDEKSSRYFAGTAVHWYDSTYKIYEEELQFAHQKNPSKYLIQTEACIDAEVPHWQDDAWYWRPEATDWGWDWAAEKDKHLHPKYVPVYRYVGDIIGCLNNYVDGWIDWNMVLNRQGGPNWFKNWCIAPVIVDEEKDEVYFTPLYYVMVHFSKFIRPDAIRIGFENSDKELQTTAVKNPDGTVAVILFNPTEKEKQVQIALHSKVLSLKISAKALQTILLK